MICQTAIDAAGAEQASKPYFLYLLECRGGRLYAGIARDVEARFKKHVRGTGARFTRAWPPVGLLATRMYPTVGDALRAEIVLKRLPRAKKRAFFDL